MGETMGCTRALAAFASGLSPADLPEEVRAALRTYLLDALGCALYGAATAPGRILAEQARDQGGAGEAALIPEGWRGPAGSVALCLGTRIHAFELDDYHSGAKLHPGAVVFAAALPLAEKRGASGAAFLTAAAAGYETVIRVGLAAPAIALRGRGFHPTGVCGPFGAAAAAARLMELDPEETVNALGVAGSQAGGTWAFNFDGSETKRFHAGRAAQSGLLAADLAARGYTGPAAVLEYEDGGFLTAYGGEGADPGRITEGLGARWETPSVSLKPHCCCASVHSTIDAVAALRAEHGLLPEEVEEIEVFNHSVVKRQCGFAYEPAGPLRAQMSIAYCAAVALIDGEAGPAQFTPERIADPALLSLARRVRFTVDPEIERIYPAAFPGKVIIRARGGQEFFHEVPGPKGSPQNPMSFEEAAEKFRRLTSDILDEETQAFTIESAARIEELPSLTPLIERLSVAGRAEGEKRTSRAGG